MELTGQIREIHEPEQVSDKFKKRDFVITTDPMGKYPQHVIVQMTQDKCDVLDGFKVGESVKAHINIKGREWNGQRGVQYFNTIECWKLDKA